MIYNIILKFDNNKIIGTLPALNEKEAKQKAIEITGLLESVIDVTSKPECKTCLYDSCDPCKPFVVFKPDSK